MQKGIPILHGPTYGSEVSSLVLYSFVFKTLAGTQA